jgi:hypothetical protein
MSLRKRLRVFTDDRRVEGLTMAIVLLYFLFIMLDFIVPEVVFTQANGVVTTAYRDFSILWQRLFWTIDLIFLTFFLLEILVRVYAWGWPYLRDVLNMVDFLIVFISFVMLWVTFDYTVNGVVAVGGSGDGSNLNTVLAMLRVFRIVRIFRIIIILNKFKRAREGAVAMSKRAKYKRQG